MTQEMTAESEEALARVRRICTRLPGVTEKLSHAAPTFFANGKVFAMFANHHHGDGHVAVWIPVEPGAQATLIATRPRVFFRPPYVGVKGWVGLEILAVDDEELAVWLVAAHRIIASPKPARTSKKRLASGG
jgi:hypothetical protein